MLTALEALVDGCHHVGGLLPGVQQSGLKGRRNKSSVSAAPWSPHTVKTPMEHVMPRCPGLSRYLVDGEDVRQEVAAAGAEQVHLLADVVLQFVEAALCRTHLSLNLRHSSQTLSTGSCCSAKTSNIRATKTHALVTSNSTPSYDCLV